jgi:hypothetical protein
MARTFALDFDAVVNTYSGWKGVDELYEPRPGLQKFLDELRFAGYTELVIHSTRDPERIESWLEKHRILGIDRITREKPLAIAYLDDRAIRFHGDFEEALKEAIGFQAYWEKREVKPPDFEAALKEAAGFLAYREKKE